MSLVARWLRCAREGEPIEVRDDNPVRDWTYAPDLAAALARVVAAPPALGPVHLGSRHLLAESVIGGADCFSIPRLRNPEGSRWDRAQVTHGAKRHPRPARVRVDRASRGIGPAFDRAGTGVTAIRFVVIGLGARSRVWLEVLGQHPRCEVVGVVDTDDVRLSAAAASVPGATAASSFEQLVEEVEADAALLCTPPAGRERQIATACAAGLAILAEKPLADSLPTATR